MNELSTDLKTHVIITFNKNEYFITKRQHEAIKSLGINQQVIFDDHIIKGSAIAEVVSMEEFYRNNPDKKQDNTNYHLKNTEELDKHIQSYYPDRKQKAMQSLIDGFKSHFKGKPIPTNAQEMCDKMVERLNKTL